jgi:hypothetical protein
MQVIAVQPPLTSVEDDLAATNRIIAVATALMGFAKGATYPAA